MGSGEKVFVFEDVAKNKERNNCWLLISGKVYDITQFLEDHPGGDEVLLAASGKDATQDFEDVGHSDDARNMMKKYYIGEVDSSTVPPPKKIKTQPHSVTRKDDESGFVSKMLPLLVPLLILGFAFGLRFLGEKGKAEA
ncbi:Cytochrome b5 [Hibiscus syriacus]|uniref:Cytochrome b5 n=1 Tax=Hibiscus syriacus TaxID=106335 RepID=A0A6A2XQ85_HIBSY|nr:cytochrome b5-like [Hibiscus syriacus]KAE8660529.1 Cytochrome b5 [Hibiscus syriacus]